MAKAKLRTRRPFLTVAQQHFFVRQFFPRFEFSGRAGVWVGYLQPTEFSRRYKVKIQYRVKTPPKIWVVSPALHPKAPHRFDDGSLCVYWAREGDWGPDMPFHETIIPWVAEWLFYYEMWLDTGKWLGSSSHASSDWPKSLEA